MSSLLIESETSWFVAHLESKLCLVRWADRCPETGLWEIAPAFSPCAFRRIRRGNPKSCPSDGGLGNYAEWVVRWIGNEKRASHAGNLPRAGIVDGKPTFQAES